MSPQRVAVVGLGYVGLPLLTLLNSRGHTAVGLDLSTSAVAKAKALGLRATVEPAEAFAQSNAIIICVPTPVDDGRVPDYTHLSAAVDSIKQHAPHDVLTIVESTVGPGATQQFVAEPLAAAWGHAVAVAHCPERLDPGNEEWPLEAIPRVIAGNNEAATAAATALYAQLLDAPLTPVSSLLAAEAVKVVENSFRDVNIAFVNELAMSFDKMGLDVVEVIEGASSKPFGFMPHWPGCGVGGHCIPVDPYYLIERAAGVGFDHRFMRLAREINETMPDYTVRRLLDLLAEQGLEVSKSKVAILGTAYKPGVADARGSPGQAMASLLAAAGADVVLYDPYVEPGHASLEAALTGCDAAILATAHPEFVAATPATWQGLSVLVDGRNALDGPAIQAQGVTYTGVGRRA